MMTTRQPLDKALRRTLEATVIKARDISELAATQALIRLGVGDSKPADYLSDEQRKLRTGLRARGRQLGDVRQDNGKQATHKLVTEVAYEHWHRMLFARFLEQNNLLMYDEYTPLSLDECNELAQDSDTARDDLERQCESGWELAGVLASKMLPQIFRIDSPVFELEFAPEHQRSLEQLVTGLSLETFQAQDSLGWVYQFWQSKRKDEVNNSEVKIGADELSPVTQLFTEPYMVSFLLDNALGAWWAGKRLTESDWQHAGSEKELRNKAAIPGVSLEYLRFVQDEQTKQWQPASGTFKAWPDDLSEFKAIDPCCGSGHFLVAIFLMLVPMRMQLENLTEQQAIDKVLSENLHGLELDQRCVELAVFALALEAWRYKDGGGYRKLPELHLACSGLSINAKKDEWLALAGMDSNLRLIFEELYNEFKGAETLGSLINPQKTLNKGTLFQFDWENIQPLLNKLILEDDEKLEMGIVAKGAAKALDLLTNKFHLVMTNPPYLGDRKQSSALKEYCATFYPNSKTELATVMVDRCIDFLVPFGVASYVVPQGWIFLKNGEKFRRSMLNKQTWSLLAKLGEGAFQSSQAQGASVALVSFINTFPDGESNVHCIDLSRKITTADKEHLLVVGDFVKINQKLQLKNPEARFLFIKQAKGILVESVALANQGIKTGDDPKWRRFYWEVPSFGVYWKPFLSTVNKNIFYSGRSGIVNWSNDGQGMVRPRIGNPSYGKKGVAISQMGELPCTLYMGELYDSNVAPIVPIESNLLNKFWHYFTSKTFKSELRKIDSKKSITNATFLKVPFIEQDIKFLLPKPFSDDPTQWIFHGHPCGSVIWDEETKWTVKGELRIDDTVLQVAVARLLGYQWPAELDTEMELAAEQRQWVERSQELNQFTDDDGIVCLPAVRGEKAADQRLEALLQAAYGDAWTTPLKNRLLETVGGKSLNQWLRDKFFEQHCKMFQHRPFIWHIWDGLNDGFSALVNYHMLDKAGLERLIYTYLGDWIRTQQSGMASGEDGAQERLAAAEVLKRELEVILEGEAPYDIFVRWKPLAEQSIGWNPDLNDGVRLNIRPFLNARDVSKKDAGVLRWKPNVKWTKDRGKDVESAPWYTSGLEYEGKEGDRINDHHLSLADKRAAREG